MKMREPECVTLKYQGAKHVSQLLAHKTRQEQLEFWHKRTEALLLSQSHQWQASSDTKNCK